MKEKVWQVYEVFIDKKYSYASNGMKVFQDISGALKWIHGSGISLDRIELYLCEKWEDGSRTWTRADLTADVT